MVTPYRELPAPLAEGIASGKPIATLARSMRAGDPEFFAMLDPANARIVDMSELPDSQAAALGDVASLCPNG